MNEIECENLFPTRLFKTKHNPKDLEDIKKYIIENHSHHQTPNKMSMNRDNAFLGLEKDVRFFSLKKDVENIFNKILSESYKTHSIEAYVCSMWSTCNIPGEGGQMHLHTNSYFSGVFYPFKETSSNICFFSPLQDKISLDIAGNVTEWNEFNCPNYEYSPQECDLIFFPSYFLHQIMFNNSKRRRYSVAFNLFLRGNLLSPTSNIILN